MPSSASSIGMRVVVHRVHAPGVARAVMAGVPDAVQRGVAHVDVGRRHVDLRAQHARAVGELAGAHAAEQIQALLDRPVAIGAVGARLGERPAMGADLVGGEVVDVRLVHRDQPLGVLVHLLEVVGRVEHLAVPAEPQPGDVLLDRLDVLDVFLRGVRVVHPEVAPAAELAGDAEVQADRLGVADVQVAVGLRGKPRVDTAAVPAGLAVGDDDLADEVEGRGVGRDRVHGSGFNCTHWGAALLCRAHIGLSVVKPADSELQAGGLRSSDVALGMLAGVRLASCPCLPVYRTVVDNDHPQMTLIPADCPLAHLTTRAGRRSRGARLRERLTGRRIHRGRCVALMRAGLEHDDEPRSRLSAVGSSARLILIDGTVSGARSRPAPV